MIDPQVSTFLQSLRGNQALVVLAYLFIQRAMTIEELEQVTGLHNDTVRAALKGLESKGRLYKQTGEHGRQTWLPAGDTFFNLPSFQNPRISDSGATTTTTIVEKKKNSEKVVAVADQSPKTSDSDGQNPKSSDSVSPEFQYHSYEASFEKNLNACRKAGIGEPAASRLAALPHVSPAFVAAHIESLYAGDTIGLAILRIENNEFPRLWSEEVQQIRRPAYQDFDDGLDPFHRPGALPGETSEDPFERGERFQ